ncbi:MAG: beta-ketoacyl synthase [Acidobacteria bacterium]|nr:MAG: beta-ketoacyl synthase [Acidobacteriota bacterium]
MFRNRANGAEPHSEFTPQFATFVEVLNWRARHQPDRVAYTFLKDGETELVDLTYQNLDHQARAIGMSLQSIGAAGERVLLLYPPGLEYVAAFYGCLYAGAVAVPAYPPRFNRNLLRLQTMIGDSEATVALTTAGLLSGVEHHFPQAPDLGALRWLATDKACNNPAVEWTHPAISSETLAFLQYTSGSTGSPKGVMLTHGNLLHNSALIQECFGTTPDSRGMVWLPPYHDMGLIGGILQPLFVGMPVTLMSHVSFLQRPLRWLQAISRSRATSSGGPNFAYDLCISKTSPEERATLDLSSWTTAFNGAEPIRPEVLERFARTFESCGFRREAFLPCYGLAEATLIVSGAKSVNPPVGRVFETQALEENRAVEMPSTGENEGGRVLVGCGRNLRDQKIAIVEPETRIQCSSGRIGEVWVSGPSVAQGYWKQPEETDRTFGAYLSDRTDGPFLRTGDLGFLQDSELFITGRLKDLIIIRGNNHYPQDLEATAEQSHWAMKSGCGAAFSVEVKGEEQLIIVHEVKREYRTINVYEVSEAIRRAIAENHGIELHSLVLLKPGSIPKTSSGKIQRHACRLNYLTANLQALGNWTQPLEQDAERAALNAAKNLEGATEQGSSPKDSSVIDNIQTWLVSCISKRLQILPGKIDVRESFAHYGLDSAAAVSISGELEQWLGRRLSPTLVYEYPTIAALALHLAADAAKTETFFADEGGALVAEEPIAIVGIGCRFPGAQNGLAFWQLLRDGVDAITEGALQRWGADIYDPDPAAPGKVNSCWGGFLDEVDQFDPHFFGISPREATRMDPQQRLLLEVAWEALEDAGLVAEQLAGTRTGVFVGISSNDYGQLQWSNHRGIDAYAGTGNALSIAANRLSYLLDFRGPSMSIDTACSSSLVAVHLACRSLWNKESTVALAGGVNLILSPGITINFTKAGVMAPDGRCKTFDARANGYVRGEGAGMVVLKPLSIALADGDPIYAMIRSTAINQDGRTNGLMAPNRHAQEAVLREAYKRAGISPGRIHYVEAHGTGTLLGDPIEAGALGTVLATDRPLGKLCAIGSVKTNIGHLEAAAGIAGLIKVALSLRHRAIPPSLHFHEPNPYIPFSELSLYVQQNLGHWPEDSDQTYAGVSSFGFGGTNAHVVLQGPARTDSAAVQPNRPTGRAELLPLSARHAGSLHSMVRAHQGFLTNGDDLNELHEVCYTAAVRRSHHDQRVAFVAHSHAELAEQLGTFLDGESCSSVFSGRKVPGKSPRPVFVFPGQGSQWFGMGRDLLRQEPVFREAMERCETAIGQHADWSLLEELAADEARWRMNEIEVVQPTLFAIQVALAAVWRSWGVEPEAVVGQSMGEVAAAHIAGALSLQDAAKVICLRSKLLKQVSGQGSMAIAELSYEQALHALVGYEDRLSIAVSSSPVSTVISGDTPALLQLMGELERRDVFCRLVNVDVASHSPQMDPLRGELLRLLAGLLPRRPSIPIYSTVTGENSDELAFDAAYWMRNLREPVLFSNSVQRLLEGGHDVFLEISPHPVLTGVVQQVLQHVGSEGCVVPSLRRGEDERAVMLGGLGALYARGYAVDWNRQYATRGRCVQLPSYPWQHERCWLEPEATDSGSEKELARSDYGNVGEHPLLGHHLKVAYPPGTHCWEVELDRAALAYLDDHRVRGAVVLPGAAFVEMALSAVTQAFGAGPRSLMGIEFNRALFLDPDRRQKLQVVISSRFGDEAAFHIYGYSFEAGPSEADWTLHATGTVRREAVDGAPPAVTLPSSEEFLKGEWEKIDPAEFYQKLTAAGLQYGPRFQMIERLQRRDGESLAKLRIPPELEQELDAYELHPAILDGCWQALAAALPAEVVATGDAGVYLPVRVDRVRVYSRHRKELWSHAHLRPVADQTTGILEGDIRLLDEAGHVVAEIVGLRSQRLDRSSEHRDVSEDLSDWLYDLQWQRLAPLKTPLDVDPSPTSPVSSWLIFIDKQGVGESLAELLATRSEKCVMVSVGEAFERIDESHFRLNPARPEHFRRLLDEAIGHEHSANCGVVHLWSLDIVVSEVVGVAALESAQAVGWPSALNLVRSLTHGGWTKPPRLWLVTRGVHAVGTAPAPAVVFQAPLWGLGRTVDFEHPEFHCSMIDLVKRDMASG